MGSSCCRQPFPSFTGSISQAVPPTNCSPLAQASAWIGTLLCTGVYPFAPQCQGAGRGGGRAEERVAVGFGVWAAAVGVAPRACAGAVLGFLALQIHRKGLPVDRSFPHPLVPGEGRREARRASARASSAGCWPALPDLSPQNQKFNYTWLRLIQHGELCVAPAGAAGTLGLRRCEDRSHSLAWLHRSLAAFQPELVSETPARAAPVAAHGPRFGLACRLTGRRKVRGVPWSSGPGFAKAVFSPAVKRWSPGAAAFAPGGRDACPAVGLHLSERRAARCSDTACHGGGETLVTLRFYVETVDSAYMEIT